jgi:hypothetical protein
VGRARRSVATPDVGWVCIPETLFCSIERLFKGARWGAQTVSARRHSACVTQRTVPRSRRLGVAVTQTCLGGAAPGVLRSTEGWMYARYRRLGMGRHGGFKSRGGVRE